MRADLAVTAEITLSRHVLPVADVKEKVAGACRRGMTRVVLPRQNEKHFERDLGDDVGRRVTVHYVRRVDDALDSVLLPVEAAGDPPPESPAAAHSAADGHGSRSAGDGRTRRARRPMPTGVQRRDTARDCQCCLGQFPLDVRSSLPARCADSRADVAQRGHQGSSAARCQRSSEREGKVDPSTTTICTGGHDSASSAGASLDECGRSPRQGRESRDSKGGAEPRALTPASTRARCWSDDARRHRTSCGRRRPSIRRILETANTRPLTRPLADPNDGTIALSCVGNHVLPEPA